MATREEGSPGANPSGYRLMKVAYEFCSRTGKSSPSRLQRQEPLFLKSSPVKRELWWYRGRITFRPVFG